MERERKRPRLPPRLFPRYDLSHAFLFFLSPLHWTPAVEDAETSSHGVKGLLGEPSGL